MKAGEGLMERTNPKRLLPCRSLRAFRHADCKMRHLPVWVKAARASHRFTTRSFVAASTAHEFLGKLASAQSLATLCTREMRTTDTCHLHTRNLVHPCSTAPEEIASRSLGFEPNHLHQLRACAFVPMHSRNPAFHDAELASASPSNLPRSFRPW